MIRVDVLFCTVFLLVAIMEPAWAAPGDKLYIQKNGVNVRTGPGTNNPVLLKLNKGHELIEFSSGQVDQRRNCPNRWEGRLDSFLLGCVHVPRRYDSRPR